MTPFGFSGNKSHETTIPSDRHTRGIDGSSGPASGRVRENAIGDMPVRQTPNRETRMFGECSRMIAQKEGQAAHEEWKARVEGDCQACSTIPH
jgi:hypothetical protein